MEIHREKRGISDGGVTESHPAFGMISLFRTTCSPPQVLFGSAVKHSNYISITIREATRESSISHDWYFGKNELIRVEISEVVGCGNFTVNGTLIPRHAKTFAEWSD